MKAVIFDMDGVLVNSEPLHFEVARIMFKEFGFYIDDEGMKGFVGMSLIKFWSTIKEQYNVQKELDWLIENDNKVRFNFFNSIDHLTPISGVIELLDLLKAAGYKLAVASSTLLKMIKVVLNKLEISDYFDYVISGHQVEHGKPAPDIFLKAAEELGSAPEECLVIEDSTNGVLAAKAAGITCLGYYNPDSGDQDLTKADTVIDSFKDISLEFLDKLFQK